MMAKPPDPDTEVFLVKRTVHQAAPHGPDSPTSDVAQIRSRCDSDIAGNRLFGRRAVRPYRSIKGGHLCERCFPD
jgi:hypothetical protein